MIAAGGGITVTGTVGSTFYVANLPFLRSWQVRVERQQSEAVSLAGSVIRQAASKSTSAGSATYSGPVLEVEAEKIRALDAGATQVYVSDGSAVYLAVMDAKVGLAVRGGKVQVDASFLVIRKVL